MQTTGRLADQFRKARFDIEVNILELALKDEVTLGDFACDPVEPFEDRRRIIARDDALRSQHFGMGAEPAISSRASRLSKSMEAFISSINAAGPPAKRPPHISFALTTEFRVAPSPVREPRHHCGRIRRRRSICDPDKRCPRKRRPAARA